MISKLTSSDVIISKIVRDLGLGDDEIPFQDFMEWIAEGLKDIGSYYQFVEKEQIIVINNYEGVLPCDFYKEIRMKDGASCSAVGPDKREVIGQVLKELGFTTAGNVGCPISPRAFQLLQVATFDKVSPYSNFYDRLFQNKNLIGNVESNKTGSKDYNINFDKITTGYQFGFLTLQYLAFPVDQNGFPMIPDDQGFFNALFWKVVYQLCMRGYDFKRKELNSLEYVDQQRVWYIGQAKGNANMPDLDMMERMKNIYTRLVPNYFEYQIDFRTNGRPQLLALDGRN